MTLTVEAPSDSQLSYITDLCQKKGQPFPEAVYSKSEASEIITALQTQTYDPARYRVDGDVPF